MEFRQLTYFLAAAQTQNFRKAAELCLVAQPALSRQIAALEKELGIELFQRVKQHVTLTAAGSEFALYAKKALEQLQQGQHAMVRIQDGLAGTIQIGCVEPLATAFLPTIFHAFHQQYPLIRLSVRVGRTDDVLALVEHGDVDLGFIFDPVVRPEVLVVKEVLRQSLQLVLPAQHPLAQTSPNTLFLEHILNEPLLLLRETSRLRRIIERIFAQRGITVQPLVEIDSIAGLRELVKQGCGITLMLPALLGTAQVDKEVAVLPIADLTEQFIFALVYRRSGTITKPARQFINKVMEVTST